MDRRRLPCHLQVCGIAFTAFSSRSATMPMKSPMRDDGNDVPEYARMESSIDRNQAGADEVAGIDAGIRWSHHAAVQHAGHAHVVHVNQFAGGLSPE